MDDLWSQGSAVQSMAQIEQANLGDDDQSWSANAEELAEQKLG
jgi:hypothetical protein